jgi:hypothetical protein
LGGFPLAAITRIAIQDRVFQWFSTQAERKIVTARFQNMFPLGYSSGPGFEKNIRGPSQSKGAGNSGNSPSNLLGLKKSLFVNV